MAISRFGYSDIVVLNILRSILGAPYKCWRVAFLCCLPIVAAQQIGAVHSADRPDELERDVSFHIDSGPLESALLQFSRQAGVQVVVGAKVGTFSVAAVDGRRNAREVLTALLSETGLKFAVVGKTVTVSTNSLKNHSPAVSPVGDVPKTEPTVGDRIGPHGHL